MAIKEELDIALKAAMRAKDQPMLSLVRMLKSKMTELTTSKGFDRPIDDALWQDVIGRYARAQEKAIEQFEKAGERGANHIAGIRFELETLAQWLPKKADEQTMAQWVDDAIIGLGGAEKANFGQVMGAVMKAHKADVDPKTVKNLINARLS